MTLVLAKRQQVEVEKVAPGEFHLQFVDATFDHGFEEADINMFLRKIFNGSSPLSYDGHRSIQHNGKTAAQVRFKLSTIGTLSNTSFEAAGRELCRLIFDLKSRKWLQNITAEGILGVSAVSIVWRSWFNQAFFAAGANQGPPLLQEVVATFKEDYLPPWALILSFSILLGLNINAIPGIVIPGMNNDGVQQLFGIAGTRWARQILAAFATSRSRRPHDEIERQWRADHNRYIACMDIAVHAIAQYTGYDDAHAVDNDLSKSVQLIDALCQMAHSAATVLTANNEMLSSFLASIDSAKKEGTLAGVGAFTSVMVINAGTAALEEVAVATAGALAMPGLAIAAGIAGTVYCIYKMRTKLKDIKKFNASVAFHKEIGAFVIQSWQLAFDTERFLEWVHCTNVTQPVPIDSVSDETRQDWDQFLNTVRQATGNVAVNREVVHAYLELRCRALVVIREGVDAADKVANPEAYKEANAGQRP